MKIKLTPEQERKYVLAKAIINLWNKYTGEARLEALEKYLIELMEDTADLFSRELLLGHVSLCSPTEWDDWTDEEKSILFDRQDVVQKMVLLSKTKTTPVEEERSLEEMFEVGEGLVN